MPSLELVEISQNCKLRWSSLMLSSVIPVWYTVYTESIGHSWSAILEIYHNGSWKPSTAKKEIKLPRWTPCCSLHVSLPDFMCWELHCLKINVVVADIGWTSISPSRILCLWIISGHVHLIMHWRHKIHNLGHVWAYCMVMSSEDWIVRQQN